MKYRIKWYALKTDATGEGEPIFTDKKMADRTAERLNREYENTVQHLVEAVKDDDEPAKT